MTFDALLANLRHASTNLCKANNNKNLIKFNCINCCRFNQCLRFKKENNLKFIWTKNGITYLWKVWKDEGTPTFAIKNETDLVRHGIVPF